MLDLKRLQKIQNKPPAVSTSEYLRNDIRTQLIREFDYYQASVPNTYPIYVNGSYEPILATIQDVSDLEVRGDTKWVLTSLENKLYAGDIFEWNKRKWLVVYEKEENAGGNFVCKAQPCTYPLNYIDVVNGKPIIKTLDTILMTYLTDMKDFKQPFPTETGTTFVSLQYNEETQRIKEGTRMFIVDSAFQITGIDTTNIDHYTGHGFYKWTLRPVDTIESLDNKELRVCDYYKYFPKDTETKPPVITPEPNENIGLYIVDDVEPKRNTTIYLDTIIKQRVDYTFVGNNDRCTLYQESDSNRCRLKISNTASILKIKATLVGNEDRYDILRIRVI